MSFSYSSCPYLLVLGATAAEDLDLQFPIAKISKQSAPKWLIFCACCNHGNHVFGKLALRPFTNSNFVALLKSTNPWQKTYLHREKKKTKKKEKEKEVDKEKEEEKKKLSV